MRPSSTSVSACLAAARARRLGALDFGAGGSAAVWRNDRDRVAYERPEGHTFSLYLAEGWGTRRVDGPPARGWPGALTVMPHGCGSAWEIAAPFTFVHLYVPDAELRRLYAESFDRDARLLDLGEATYAEAPAAAEALRGLARAAGRGDAMAGEAAAVEALAALLADPRWCGARRGALRGGLAPHIGRRVADYVEARLDGPIRLAELAGLAGLSAFHFQRAFRASRGTTPHAYVARRRAARAAALLRGPEPIAEIALGCGFSGQSHLTRAFKAATGLTPAEYRRRARDQ